MTGPVGQRLGQRLDEMATVVAELRAAEADADRKRHLANVEEYKAFLGATGAVERCKIWAKYETEALDFEATVAESLVKHLLRELRLADKRVEVGRTYSADIRAEAKTIGLTPGTWT